jgi:hypothetical protein
MRIIRRTAGLAGCLFLAAGCLLAQDQTGAIAGTVIDAATHQPVKKATINVNSLTAQRGAGLPNQAASTDATGAFSLDALPEGRYILMATHPNYPQGSRPSPQTVEVKAGGKASVTLELIPGVVITGHILDEEGDPMSGCFVQASVPQHPEQGRGNGSNTNPDGEYRIHGLAPGKYILMARCGGTPFVPRPFSAGPDPPPSMAYPAQFYPLAYDAKSAQLLDLAPGVEKPGVDFRMRPAAVTQVRGNVSPSGQNGLNIQLISAIGNGSGQMGASFNPAKGTFEFDRVFPGSYYLVVVSNGDPAGRLSAVQRIDVKDRPLEAALTLAHGVDLAGAVTIEDNRSTNKIPLTQIQVQLQPDPPLPIGQDLAPVKEDGTFVLKSVAAARWKLIVFGSQLYLKSAWLGSTDVTHAPFEVSTGAESLRLVLSTALGTITGTAPAGEMVYAVADDPSLGVRTAQADQTGRYTLPQFPPGKYRVGVMDPGAPIPDEGGHEITLHEGETLTVDVK